MLLDKIFPKDNPLLRALIVVFLTFAFFIFLIEPLAQKNRALNKAIAGKTDELARFQRMLQRSSAIEQEYKASLSGSEIQQGGDSLIFSLKALEEIASRYAIKILDIKQGTPVSGNKPSVPIELLLEGKKEDYVKFIYELADGKLLFDIKRCDFKSRENSNLLEAKFVISYSLIR
ncbi:MAG: hypothetical protein NTY14_03320 [Candidatus Omnitrophica bacterium]|nr:hypothetical protein [Candidatus Omnitrophota bacterium]